MPSEQVREMTGIVRVFGCDSRPLGWPMPTDCTIGAQEMSRLQKDAAAKRTGVGSGRSHARRRSFSTTSFKKLIDFGLEPEPLYGVYPTGRSSQKRNVLNNLRRYNWHVRGKIDGWPVTCFDLVNERLREALRA